VHDLFGHAKTGFEFGVRGELNATRAHAQMFDNKARGALVTETVGQNMWVNFSKENKDLPPSERAYARQKVDLLPEELYAPVIGEVNPRQRVAYSNALAEQPPVVEGRTPTTKLDVLPDGVVHDILREPVAQNNQALENLQRVYADKGRMALDYLDGVIGRPADLKTSLMEQSSFPGRTTFYENGKSHIELALNAKDILSAAAHEGYHYLEEKVLNGPERTVIARELAPGTDMYKKILEQANKYDKVHGTDISHEISGNIREARAYGFEMWRRGDLAASNMLSRAWAKLKDILTKTKNYFDGLGFTSIEDIFASIDKGKYA
jgi:hypothetical protein